MFFIRRPSREAIDRFVRDSQELPLSYGPIGIVNGDTPCRDLDEAIVTIGRGRTDFDRARAALMAALARIGQRFVRALQARFRRDSAGVMKRAIEADGVRR